jgi:hypothetical protein
VVGSIADIETVGLGRALQMTAVLPLIAIVAALFLPKNNLSSQK